MGIVCGNVPCWMLLAVLNIMAQKIVCDTIMEDGALEGDYAPYKMAMMII